MNNKENFIGYDPIDGHKIIVLGELKDKIHPKVEIKRGNEKELREDIGHQIVNLGYSYLYHEGGNHIEFKDKKGLELYIIEWHFDEEHRKDNIIKRVCKEFNMTQKELSDELDVPTPTMSRWAKGDIPKMANIALNLMIENKNLKEKFEILKKAHKILSEE